MFGKLLVSLARTFFPNYVNVAKKTNLGQLVTISFSHYNEMARWCLQVGNVRFHENAYPPVAHILPSLQAHKSKGVTSKSAISKASPTSTPVLVLPTGELLADSWSICDYAAKQSNGLLLPLNDKHLRLLLDDKMGVYVRYGAYYYVLSDTNKASCEGMFLEDTHWLWRAFWMLGGKFLVRGMMVSVFKATDKEHFLSVRKKLEELVDTYFDPLVRNRTSKYLSGDQIGVLDIAVASLLAPMLNVPQYAEGRYFKFFDVMERTDSDMAAEVAYWRGKEVGKYVMELYTTQRHAISK